DLKSHKETDIKEAAREFENRLTDIKWNDALTEKHTNASNLAKAKLSSNSVSEYRDILTQHSAHLDRSGINSKELLAKIDHATHFLRKQAVRSEDDILTTYKLGGSLDRIHNELLTECRAHSFKI